MQITLLKLEPIEKPALGQNGQADLFNHLLNQLQSGSPPSSMKQLVEDMRCKSPLPILSRLKHLEERGYVLVTQA